MKRRSFLQFFGLAAPAAAVLPKAAEAMEKFEATAKALEPAAEPKVEVYETQRGARRHLRHHVLRLHIGFHVRHANSPPVGY
jgi:hypothetical protein